MSIDDTTVQSTWLESPQRGLSIGTDKCGFERLLER